MTLSMIDKMLPIVGSGFPTSVFVCVHCEQTPNPDQRTNPHFLSHCWKDVGFSFKSSFYKILLQVQN
jgi:hypothetical protein